MNQNTKSRTVVLLAFVGGLGDILLRFFLRDTYLYLASVKIPVDILLFSPNPYVEQLFEHHPNRKNFRIHTFSEHPDFLEKYFKFSADQKEQREIYKNSFLRELLGDDFKVREPQPLPAGARLTFYTSFKDRLRALSYAVKKYAVVQPFTTSSKRDIPKEILREIIEALCARDLDVVIPVQKNVRTISTKKPFSSEAFLKENILRKIKNPEKVHVVRETTPMVLKIIQRCRFFAGGDSGFIKAAWHYQKPNILLAPQILFERSSHKIQMQNKTGIYFGAGRQNTFFSTFESFDAGAMREFVAKFF